MSRKKKKNKFFICCIKKLGAIFPISGVTEEEIREIFERKNLKVELEPISPTQAKEIRKEIYKDIFFQT